MKVLIDTNVIVDVLQSREPWCKQGQAIFMAVANKRVSGCITAKEAADIHFFGDELYSKEELVAETTAATILNAIGMEEANTFRNSAAYIKGWASRIKADPLMYVSAATKAQAAVDLIMGVGAVEAVEA